MYYSLAVILSDQIDKPFAYLFMPVLYYGHFALISFFVKYFFSERQVHSVTVIQYMAITGLSTLGTWIILRSLDEVSIMTLHALKIFLLLFVPSLIGVYNFERKLDNMSNREKEEIASQIKK